MSTIHFDSPEATVWHGDCIDVMRGLPACLREGFRCIAIEREADYLPLIMHRVDKPHAVGLDFGDWEDAS